MYVVVFFLFQARQRSGRAGREGPGECYRLYTEESFQGKAHYVIIMSLIITIYHLFQIQCCTCVLQPPHLRNVLPFSE